MPSNLTFSNVIYDPGTLYAEWIATLPPHFTGYRVDLTPAGGATQTFTTQVGNITINETLSPTTDYTLTVTVMVDNEPTDQTASVEVITSPPILTLVDNGGSSLLLAWAAASGAGVTGYLAHLVEVLHQSWTQETDAATLTTTFPLTLKSTSTYTVDVRASGDNGVVLGPPSQVLAPITTAPTITAASNDVTESNLWWAPAAGDDIEAYAANLLQVDGASWWQYTDGDERHATFAVALDPQYEYTVAVRATDAGVVVLGPPSTVLTMITVAPTFTLVDNSGTALGLYWAPVSGGVVDGYLAALEQTGSQRWTTSTNADTRTASFAVELIVGNAYACWVRATNTNGVVLGPPSQVLAPIAGAPVMALVNNSGADVRYTWTAAPGLAVEGYLAILTQVGGSIWTASTDAATLAATFTQQLNPALAYTSVVRASNSNDVVLGPPSDLLVPLTSSPGSPTVGTTGTQFEIGWKADANPEVTGYVAELFADGNSQGERQTAAAPAVYAGPLATGVIYTGTARSAGTKVLGPWTAPAVGPYAANAVIDYDAFGRTETITWNTTHTASYTYDDAGNITASTGS
ncbi:MAG: hypothetical protein JST22_12250 [Bacteroidetes bacterium]|nr:hypothetical protein [Bacteroidota bacterium]